MIEKERMMNELEKRIREEKGIPNNLPLFGHSIVPKNNPPV